MAVYANIGILTTPLVVEPQDWDSIGLSTVITPTLLTNSVLIDATIEGCSDGQNNLFFALYRNNVQIGVGSAAGDRTQCGALFGFGDGGVPGPGVNLRFIDTPGGLSAVTYSVKAKLLNGNGYINRGADDADADYSPRLSSVITVQQVVLL